MGWYEVVSTLTLITAIVAIGFGSYAMGWNRGFSKALEIQLNNDDDQEVVS